jgi:hypothetical protein
MCPSTTSVCGLELLVYVVLSYYNDQELQTPFFYTCAHTILFVYFFFVFSIIILYRSDTYIDPDSQFKRNKRFVLTSCKKN